MKGWRTILFNVATLAASAGDLLPVKYAFYVVTVGNLVLRAFTTTSIGRSE